MITLEAFAQQKPHSGQNFELIVVDDGSHCPVKDVVDAKAYPYELRIITQGNNGRSAARNTGIRHAATDILIFCDCDRFPGKNFVNEHMTIMGHSGGKVCIGEIAEIYVSNLSQLKQNVSEDADFYQHKYRIPRYSRLTSVLLQGMGTTASGIPWAHTLIGNMSVHKDAVLEVGGLDEGFTSWGLEHFDLGYRLWKSGYIFQSTPARNYHIAHKRDIGAMSDEIRESIQYMMGKYNDESIKSLGRFMCSECSLQDFETNKNAAWLMEAQSEVLFRLGSL